MLEFDNRQKDFMFSDEDIKSITDFCNTIYNNNRKGNVKDRKKDSSRSGIDINLQGISAEIWFKERYSLPYTLDLDSPDTKNRNYLKDIDAEYSNLVFEIKQTKHDNGCFFISGRDWYGKERKLISDIYVLIVGEFPNNYKKCLFITKSKLIKLNSDAAGNLQPSMHKRIGQYGYHVEQSDMYSTLTDCMAWENEGAAQAA
ncbi:MAG: hypothetical protein VW496_02385 [Pelagibacteraceae bacterium]